MPLSLLLLRLSLRNIEIVKSKLFMDLFIRHCVADCAVCLEDTESVKSGLYFRDQSKSSLAFNQYLKNSYAFHYSEAGLLAVNNDICFLIDSENTLVILGTNPLMMVHEIARDDVNHGFSEILDLQSFEAQYIKLFGSAPTLFSNDGYNALYLQLPVWCPGINTAYQDGA